MVWLSGQMLDEDLIPYSVIEFVCSSAVGAATVTGWFEGWYE